MEFTVLGTIYLKETIASGSGIREIDRLRKIYGRGRWRKRKGFATVRLNNGRIVEAELHWYAASSIGKVSEFCDGSMNNPHFAVCINNRDFEVSLETRKLYEIVPDIIAEKEGMIRVIDESGEDYLYPADNFLRISLPESVERAVSQLS